MKQKEAQFKIDQLRKDKIIFAVEACATAIICVFVFQFSNFYLDSPVKNIINISTLIIGVGYTIYMGVGNFLRLREIQDLEKNLYD